MRSTFFLLGKGSNRFLFLSVLSGMLSPAAFVVGSGRRSGIGIGTALSFPFLPMLPFGVIAEMLSDARIRHRPRASVPKRLYAYLLAFTHRQLNKT